MIRITDASDARLDPYRNLRDRVLARDGGRFLAESKAIVRRALDAGLRFESVLADERRADEMVEAVGDRSPLYVVPESVMTALAGFDIHTGVLAVAYRPPAIGAMELLRDAYDPVTLLVAPKVKEPANLGALVRTAAAFGVTGLIIGPECCDPFYRRAVRVSMGAVFRLPIVRSGDIIADLQHLHDVFHVQRIATVLDESAEPLHTADRPTRIALLMGHEVTGVTDAEVAACDRRVTIPVHLGTDSLNVSVAAAVFCYHFMSPAKPIRLSEATE